MQNSFVNTLKCVKYSCSMLNNVLNRCYSNEAVMNIFDRKLKRLQKNNSALQDDHLIYDYIRDEVYTIVILHNKILIISRYIAI